MQRQQTLDKSCWGNVLFSIISLKASTCFLDCRSCSPRFSLTSESVSVRQFNPPLFPLVHNYMQDITWLRDTLQTISSRATLAITKSSLNRVKQQKVVPNSPSTSSSSGSQHHTRLVPIMSTTNSPEAPTNVLRERKINHAVFEDRPSSASSDGQQSSQFEQEDPVKPQKTFGRTPDGTSKSPKVCLLDTLTTTNVESLQSSLFQSRMIWCPNS